MATLYGIAHIHSLTGATITMAGAVKANPQGGSLSSTGDIEEIKGQTGKITGLIVENDVLECNFDLIPEGTTIANAKVDANLPAVGSPITISGMPVITAGGYADAFNTGAAGPWFYQNGRINFLADGKWTLSFTAKRYPQITSATAIT